MRFGSALRSPSLRTLRQGSPHLGSPRPFRPRLEALEDRDCPSMTPTISLMVMPAGQQSFTLSGHVMDDAPSGLIVQFNGAYEGSTQTNPTGGFSVTVTPSQLGAITATVTDNEGKTAIPAQQTLSSLAPWITLSASRLGENLWVFTGMVMDECAANLTVRFGGLASLQNKQATVGSNGMFSLTVELAEGEEGTATAQTRDAWGLNSNVAQYIVQPSV